MGSVTRKIRWTTPAVFDQRRLRAWVERYSGHQSARVTGQRLTQILASLQENPRLGVRQAVPDGGSEELRELVVKPFIIRYIVTDVYVSIVRMWHERENLRFPTEN